MTTATMTDTPYAKKNLLARCVMATGSTTAAILLYRICYWHPYAKASAEGLRWIAKDRDTWMAETGLTAQQYRTARECLHHRLLVTSRQGRFGSRTITFMGLTKRGQGVREGLLAEPDSAIDCTFEHEVVCGKHPTPGGSNPHTTQGQIHTPGCAENTPPYIMGDTVMGDTEWEIPKGDQQADAGKNFQVVNPDLPSYPEDSKEADPVATIKEILAQGKKPVSLTKKKPPSPAEVWQQTMIGFSDEYQPTLTIKETAQLKNFGNKCPGGDYTKVIQEIIFQWPQFSASVKASAGLAMIPSSPNIGFALKYVAEAIAFVNPKTQVYGTNTLKTVPKASTITKPKSAPDDEAPMTKEDMAKLMGGDDSE